MTTELLKYVFIQAGARHDELVEGAGSAGVSIAVYTRSKARTERLARAVRALCLKRCRFRSRVLHSEDWLDKWKRDVRPVAFTMFAGIKRQGLGGHIV